MLAVLLASDGPVLLVIGVLVAAVLVLLWMLAWPATIPDLDVEAEWEAELREYQRRDLLELRELGRTPRRRSSDR